MGIPRNTRNTKPNGQGLHDFNQKKKKNKSKRQINFVNDNNSENILSIS